MQRGDTTQIRRGVHALNASSVRAWGTRAGQALLALALVSGCGPTLYTAKLIPAERTLEQAKQANAIDRAPYEYYFARANLEKAREEAAQGHYEDAIHFAELAEEYAMRARQEADRNRSDTEPTE